MALIRAGTRRSRTARVAATLAAATALAACGMRGGSTATLIDGIPSSGAGQGAGPGSGVPAGVSLTASAPGITPTTIHIGTIEDITGPVPGLFESSLDSVKAWVAYVNSQGGIAGRHVVLDAYDSGLNPTNFQTSMAKACTDDFAVIGAISAVDNAGAVTGQQCGIPDIPDNPTTPQAAAGTNVFPVDPSLPNVYPTGWFEWVKSNFPNAASHAAILWPGIPTTETTGQRLEDTAKSVGFDFVYQNSTSAIESDFTPFVQQMQSKGAEYFAWQADWQSVSRILQAMAQLNYQPQVFDATATAYNDQFLKTAGSVANGIYLSLNTALFSERNVNQEMNTYLTWLDKSVPGHVAPDIFGIYAWAAGAMFEQAMKTAGPNPTRAHFISALKGITNFDGNGIIAPVDPGDKKSTTCFEVVTVKSGSFVRVHPTTPNTFDCSTGTLYTDPAIPPASLNGS